MKKILIIPFLFLCFVLSGQTTYYIDPTGTDGAGVNGSIGTPWKTLAYACTRVTTATDTIYVNAGIYNETVRCDLSVGVSIKGAGVTSVINSTYYLATFGYGAISLYSTAQGTNGNQTISYVKLTGTNLTSYTGIAVRYRSNVRIHNCIIQDFIAAGISLSGGSVGASLSDPGTPPATYETGNKIYNCTITNCTGSHSLQGGLIRYNSQEGLLIYDNTLTQNSRAEGNNGNIIKAWGGHDKGVKFYNNISTKGNQNTGWNFHMETGSLRGGFEIYNNQFLGGGVGIDIGGYDNIKTTYDYTAWIHDNIIKLDAKIVSGTTYSQNWGITLEGECRDIIVNRNHIKNYPSAISLVVGQAPRTSTNIIISYNIMENIGYSDNGWVMMNQVNSYTAGGGSSISNVYWDNNVIMGGNGRSAMYINSTDLVQNVYIRNNIIANSNGYGWLTFWDGAGTIDNIHVQNNILYNNINNNQEYYYLGKTVSNFTKTNTINSDPLFVTSTNFYLQSQSPAINSGLNLDYTLDYDSVAVGNPPEIGALEYIPPDPPVAPVVIYNNVLNKLTVREISLDGNVTNDGGGTVSDRGVCWKLTANPVITDSHIHYSNGTGEFTASIPVVANTTYYIRFFCTNEDSTTYSEEVVFTTPVYSQAVSGGKIQMIGTKRAVIY